MKWVKQTRANWRSGLPNPKAPLLKIHGGAGCGKSTLINILSRFVEHFLSINSDKDPNKPAVVKVAPTAKAARNIDGMTYHTALGLPWGNQCFSLSDRQRDTKRSQLSELKLIIVDEMSMLKSDALYQIHLRLQEITQSQNSFGGVAVLLSGDLMQIPPVAARWIFQEPAEEVYQLSHAIDPLWEQFQPIELRHNHRQGNDRVYGDLLNRMRRGKHTPEDMEMLKARLTDVFPEDKDTLYLYGTNKLVYKHNMEELSILDGEPQVFKAVHINKRRQGWIPPINEFGVVKDTPYLDELHLKVGARVMITRNVRQDDGLLNGTMGIVVGFAKDRGRVSKVLVECDKKKDGEKTRKKYEAALKRLNMSKATPIGRDSFEYSLGKAQKEHSAKATVIQFPLTTAWGVTMHKCQGENIISPKPLVVDMASVHKKGHGMAYVALGRIQNIDQLHLKSFAPEKIMISQEAEAEARKLEQGALNNVGNRDKWNQDWKMTNSFLLKIVSLNIRSLRAHFLDIQADPTMLEADIICLQETWLHKSDVVPAIPGYTHYFAGEGKGKGVAIYIKKHLEKNRKLHVERLGNNEFYQGLKLYLNDLQLLNIYRPPNPTSAGHLNNFLQEIKANIHATQQTVICGDLNFNYLKEPKHRIAGMLQGLGFHQKVKEPTTIYGSCLDHVYLRTKCLYKYSLHYPYFSDHECICLMLKKPVLK